MAGLTFGSTRPLGFGQAPQSYTPGAGGMFTTQQAGTPTPFAPGYTPPSYKSPQAYQNQNAAQTARSVFQSGFTNAAPEFTYNAAERARAEALAGLQSGNFADREAALRADYSANIRGSQLDDQAIGVRRGAANRDAGYYQGLLDLMPYYANLSGKELERALGEARRTGTMERLGIDSDYTGRGSYFSGMRSLKNYSSILGQQAQELGANIGYGRDVLGQREKTMGLERSKAMTGDQLALLDIEAQKNGGSRDKYKASLDQGLASLGYDRFMSMDQLFQKLNSADYQQAQLARQIIDSALAAGNALQSGQLGSAYGGFN